MDSTAANTRPPLEQASRKGYVRARPRETSPEVSGEPLLRLASPEANVMRLQRRLHGVLGIGGAEANPLGPW